MKIGKYLAEFHNSFVLLSWDAKGKALQVDLEEIISAYVLEHVIKARHVIDTFRRNQQEFADDPLCRQVMFEVDITVKDSAEKLLLDAYNRLFKTYLTLELLKG